jgi:hypothetical protein
MKTPNFLNCGHDALARSKAYMRAVRPRMGLFAVAWLIAGYFRFDMPVNFEAVVTVCTVALLTSAIVVQNDFYDRNHDRKKDRLLASERPGPFSRLYRCPVDIDRMRDLPGVADQHTCGKHVGGHRNNWLPLLLV